MLLKSLGYHTGKREAYVFKDGCNLYFIKNQPFRLSTSRWLERPGHRDAVTRTGHLLL